MVEISESEYNKLRKDADDNLQLKSIIKIIVGSLIVIILFLILFLCVLKPILDNQMEKYNAIVKNEIALNNAYNNVEIFKIEKGDMSIDDYVKWKSVNQDTD